MLLIIGLIAAAVITIFLMRNASRNSDPLNRQAAAEICEYLASTQFAEVEDVALILERHDRSNSQGNHIASMVPALLQKAGLPTKLALDTQHIVRAAAQGRP